MKITRCLSLLVPVFTLVACFAADPTADVASQSLRVIKIDKENNRAWYVPTRAIISGPGQATAPMQLLIGDKKLVQGMISLKEDPVEFDKLAAELKKAHGPEMSLSKELTTNVSVKVSVGSETLWEHQIFSGSQGMPFQATVAANASASLKVNLHFTPAWADSRAKSSMTSFSHSKTQFSTGQQASGSEQSTASFSATESNLIQGDFTVEQTIDF